MPHILSIDSAYIANFTARVPYDEYTIVPTAAPVTHTDDSPELRQRIITRYQEGVAILCDVLDATKDKAACHKLKAFAKTVEEGINEFFPPLVRENYMTLVYWDFDLICTLAKYEEQSKDWIKQAILELTQGLGVCAPGMAQHIETTARELSAFKKGMPQKFVNLLNQLIDQHILGLMHRFKINYTKEYEIHHVAAFFNHAASHFGLPQRQDALMPKIDKELLECCNQSIYKAVTMDHVVRYMAEDCLSRIHAFYAPSHPNVKANAFDQATYYELGQKFIETLQPGLAPLFGSINYQDVLYEDGEHYRLTSDTTLIALSIAHNLRHAGIFESFKAAYVIGDKGADVKFKQLGGTLFYVKSPLASPSRHSLTQYVWENHEKGRALLQQIEDKATNNPSVERMQEEYWKNFPVSFIREMVAAPTLKSAEVRIKQATSLLESTVAATTTLATMMSNALIRASDEGNEGAVRALFHAIPMDTHAALAEQSDNFGETAMMRAAENGRAGVVKAWLEHGADVHQTSRGVETALTLAAWKGQTDVVKILLKAKANPNHINSLENTALMLAASHNHLDVVDILLKAKANPNHVNTLGNTTLIQAASRNKLDVVKLLLAYDANVNFTQKKSQNSALTLASYYGHVEIVKVLLAAGAKPNHADSIGFTSLMMAAVNNKLEIVKVLLAAGAHVNLATKIGNTALMLVAECGHVDIMRELLTYGADVHCIQKESKDTALTMASDRGHVDIIRVLLEAGADVDHVDSIAFTPLISATIKGRLEAVKILLAAGAIVNLTTKYGNTALSLASDKGHVDIVRELLAAGADVRHTNKAGMTARQLAKKAHHADLIEILHTAEHARSSCSIM